MPEPQPQPSDAPWLGVWALVIGAALAVAGAWIIWGLGASLFGLGLFICAGGAALVTRSPNANTP